MGCQLNPSHSLRQGQANFSFTYTHTQRRADHGPAWTHTHKQENKQACTDSNTCPCGHARRVDWYTHTNTCTHSHIHTQARGPGLNRVNPSTAGGGNPMQVTYSKESRASRGGLMMTKQGWWMLAGTLSWTWVGLHGEDTMSGTCLEGGGANGGRGGWVLERDGWLPLCLQDVFT